MKAKLVERGATPDQTREIPVTQSEFLIGRGPDCDLRLRVDNISRHHCLIRLANDEATLIDLGSSNGTFLNGERVRSSSTLHSGDELRVGTCRFRVEVGEAQPSDGDTAVGAGPFMRTVKLPPEVTKAASAQNAPASSEDSTKP
jgi:pSer/pThr/pTyr-binding forkhead associated (FHA) protein